LNYLKDIKVAADKKKDFYYWIVGLDLFGDELGYPYCPFVAWPFIEYIKDQQEREGGNPNFGLRIHCGENVPFADNDVDVYRHFIAHMYIVFRCLSFLQRKLKKGIRVGHGVAFARILSGNMSNSTHRKSSVLLADMNYHAQFVLENIAFEVNITSNEYLLGLALRGGDYQQTIRLDALRDYNIPIILSTDDDGIWPIDHCPSKHPGHHSLVAEYCRAFSSSLITSSGQLQNILENTKRFCFSSLNTKLSEQKSKSKTKAFFYDDKYASTIIFHPDVVMALLRKYYDNERTNTPCYLYFSSHYPPSSYKFSHAGNTNWDAICASFARFAFLFYYTQEPKKPLRDFDEEYSTIFGTNPTLTDVHKIWKDVWYQFMYPNDIKEGHHIPKDPLEGPVFLSESSHHEMQALPHLLQYMENDYHLEHPVHVFTREISEPETNQNFTTKLQRSLSDGALIRVFSTKNKETCVDLDLHDKIKLEINKQPEQRTNYFNEEEQHVLYVVCHNASAATAYLHYYGKKFSEQDQSHKEAEGSTKEQ
jgi:hypothetical protein